jgi:hypothetical protein
MTSHDDVVLRKVGEPEFNSLPRGVRLLVLNDRVIFVRRSGAHFIPLPEVEQEKLRKKHIQ